MNIAKVLLILGTRPQIIKSAPVIHAVSHDSGISLQIVHTGQHYDYDLSKQFFDELNLPDPMVNLNIGSGTHAWQTGKMMISLEKVLLKEKPRMVIVPGDTNSALAGALASVKLHVPVAHLEAGPRSYNMKIPEEVNRVLTDHCSTLLFAPTENCAENLKKEGIGKGSVHLVGDTMYDSLLQHLPGLSREKILERLDLGAKEYAVLTTHRPDNVDTPQILRRILGGVMRIRGLTTIFPIHPRTLRGVKKAGIRMEELRRANIKPIKPLKHEEMLRVIRDAKVVMTDSGGMQKESFWLGTPCLTLRKETEWPETLESGANTLVGTDPGRIFSEVQRIIEERRIKQRSEVDPRLFGDGKAAHRILFILRKSCLQS